MADRNTVRRFYEEREAAFDAIDGTHPLNVELLSQTLDDRLPAQNRDDHEDYKRTLEQLERSGIRTVGDLHRLIARSLEWALGLEASFVERSIPAGAEEIVDHWLGERYLVVPLEGGGSLRTTAARMDAGVFLTHQGFVERMLRHL